VVATGVFNIGSAVSDFFESLETQQLPFRTAAIYKAYVHECNFHEFNM